MSPRMNRMAKNVSPRAQVKRGIGTGSRISKGLQRAANNTRMTSRLIRQQGRLNQTSTPNRIRPLVKPANKPVRVMPERPSPKAVRKVVHTATQKRAGLSEQNVKGNIQPKPLPNSNLSLRAQQRRSLNRVIPKQGVAGGVNLTAFAINVSGAHPQIVSEVNQLQSSLNSLKQLANFNDLEVDATDLEKDLVHAFDLLESAREKKYFYQKDLEDIAVNAMSRWQSMKENIFADIQKKGTLATNSLLPLVALVNRLNSSLGNPTLASSNIRNTQTQINSLANSIKNSRNMVSALYSDIESDTYQLTSRLSAIHWMLEQLADAKFTLITGEEIIRVVSARWDQEGDDDPEGVLFLSTKRIIFERKEKVAKKKVLFVTVEKELIHEVLIDEVLSNIKGVQAENKGLFGHQDFVVVNFLNRGDISFHLDGQNSDLWASLIEQTLTGKIADDRSTGSSLSLADLSGELTQADILEVQNEVNSLLEDINFKDLVDEIEEINREVYSIERNLGEIRARGYVFEISLEQEVDILISQWDRIKNNTQSALNYQVKLLTDQANRVQAKMAQLAGNSDNLTSARPIYLELKSMIASAEAQTVASEDIILAQYDEYRIEISGLTSHLDWVDWMLDALTTASFKLYATEGGVAAIEAIYLSPGSDPENGVLYLTDQRVCWEDRVGEYQLRVDIPLQQIVSVKNEIVEDPEGIADEFLIFEFDGNATLSDARFDLVAPISSEWLKMVGRARNGDYQRDRAFEIDQDEVDRIKNAPTKCSNCSAVFTSPILRGQIQIICDYCGSVTNI